MSRVSLLGVPFDSLPMEDFLSRAMELIPRHGGCTAVTPNSEMVLAARRNPALQQALEQADLSLPDSAGVMLASRILNLDLKEKVPGIDFAFALLARLNRCGGSVYLFGGTEERSALAARQLQLRYPGIRLCGVCSGYDVREEELENELKAARPDFLMVCLGSPKQELWIQSHRGKLPVGLMAGLGGTVDVLSGQTELAPRPMRDAGLEWLYRLWKEPRRLGRMIKLPGILVLALEARWKRKNTWTKEN